MVPSVSKPSRSFKGAAAYYLHDKGAQTAERVAFTETRNLPTNDPQRAVAHMIDTAENAVALKQAAGLRATGRKLENPVYSYSLAWSPGETPSRQQMVDAARDTLNALGLDKHQALFVAHNDTKHPHIHVIANRVDPETGRAANMGKDHLILSRWAEGYERERGHVYCRQRAANNNARRRGEWRKDQSPDPQEWRAWKKAENAKLWEQYRAEKAEAAGDFKTQAEALWQQKQERTGTVRQQVKAAYKPEWRALFKRQRRELQEFDRSLLGRLRYLARSPEGRGPMRTFLKAVFGSERTRAEFLKTQKAERDALGQRHKSAIRDAAREIGYAWQHQNEQLKEQHQQARAERVRSYKERSDEIWKTPPPEQDRPESLSEQQRRAAEPRQAAQQPQPSQDDGNALDERMQGLAGKMNRAAQQRAASPSQASPRPDSGRSEEAERPKARQPDASEARVPRSPESQGQKGPEAPPEPRMAPKPPSWAAPPKRGRAASPPPGQAEHRASQAAKQEDQRPTEAHRAAATPQSRDDDTPRNHGPAAQRPSEPQTKDRQPPRPESGRSGEAERPKAQQPGASEARAPRSAEGQDQKRPSEAHRAASRPQPQDASPNQEQRSQRSAEAEKKASRPKAEDTQAPEEQRDTAEILAERQKRKRERSRGSRGRTRRR